MTRLLLALLVTAGVVLAGCAQKGESPAPTSATRVDAASTNATAPAAPPSNATKNEAPKTNATSSNDMPQDPGSCMRGMDHPGCTAQQAENYYKKWQAEQAAKGPPPDRALSPIKISLSPQGMNQGASANIDEGTMKLFITVYLNDTGAGPYVALGPDPTTNIQVVLKGQNTTKTIDLQGTSASVGVDPATPLAMKATGIIDMPESAIWSVNVVGQGQNARVELDILEHFIMDM